MIYEKQFRKFLKINHLSINIIKVWGNDDETAYTVEGYYKDNCLFDCNEFYIKNTIKLDVLKSDFVDLLGALQKLDWVYEMFIESAGSYEFKKYVGKNIVFKTIEEIEDCKNKI